MPILYALEPIRNPVTDALMLAATYIGGARLFLIVPLVVYWCVSKKYGYYLMAVGLIGTAVNQFLKIVCQVPRPWVRDPDFTIVEAARGGATGYSFPSGHSQNAAGILGGVARFTKTKAVRAVCIVLIALVAFSRMYLGVHYPTDVAVGLLCGLLLVFALYPAFNGVGRDVSVVSAVFGIAALCCLSAALYVEFRSWPGGVDVNNLLSAIGSLYMICGCTAGVAVGAPVERRRIGFDVKAPWWAQILKAVLGLALLYGLRAALEALPLSFFGGFELAITVRYAILALFGILVWPLTFPWFARGCRRAKKDEEE